ncbi:FtsX-like permease family protein [Gracilibacillus sp. S3-1-1]|uniref:FtsX-like permease family protein n=1 Tax=Gracilibacillus pellucidus TaxID=3095368 RepID=A0ACC6M365_9BACI|nr:FtsX-like permease family protein [Gracilibacillus sp. S3-1-1]MDX8045348.1 FtsX-like permease family protein [Gracilibacillus sp. S3-1-1]
MNLFQLASKNIFHKKILSLLTILSVAIGTALIVFILLAEDGIESGAAKGYGPYELVIGAEGSGTQLALNTFYHIGAPTGNILHEAYEELLESDSVEEAYPITKGDNYNGFQIVGTPSGYLSTRYPDAVLQEGALYQDSGEVVLGANVAKEQGLNIGDEFVGSHGVVAGAHHDDHHDDHHQEFIYEVVGILPQLHTPDDKAIFTTLDYAWLVHQDEGHEDEGGHDDKEITAIVVKPKGLIELQSLKQQFDEMTGAQAVYSSKAIADVLNIVDVGAKVIKFITVASILISAISIMLSLSASAAERKKDIGLLRLIGKSRFYVLGEMIVEGQLLTIIGVVFGLLLGHVGSYILSDFIFAYAGIQISPWTPIFSEIYIIIGAFLIGTLSSILPALRSYKVQPLELFKS